MVFKKKFTFYLSDHRTVFHFAILKSLGPHKAVRFLGLVSVWFPLCTVRFKLGFVDAAPNCVHRDWFLNGYNDFHDRILFLLKCHVRL